MKSIDINDLKTIREKNDPDSDLLYQTIHNKKLSKALYNSKSVSKITHSFSNSLAKNIKLGDQRDTGLCWIYTFMHFILFFTDERFTLPTNFELSHNYLSFYDKLERSIYFLQNVWKYRNISEDSQMYQYLFGEPFTLIDSGGNWSMLMNLISKYGLVPKSVMPDTYHMKSDVEFYDLLRENLFSMAYEIRTNNFSKRRFDKYIDTYALPRIWYILTIFFGEPPDEFDWKYKSERYEDLTPLEFFDMVFDFNPLDWGILLNLSRNRKYKEKEYKLNNVYNIKLCSNMIDARYAFHVLNIDIDTFTKACKESIDCGNPVWAGIASTESYSCEHGVYDHKLYNRHPKLYPKKRLEKRDSVRYNIYRADHAILIIGYNLDKRGKIDKWEGLNTYGYNLCTDDKDNKAKRRKLKTVVIDHEWFLDNVFQIVVEKTILPKKIAKLFDNKTIDVSPYDSLISCNLMNVY